MGQDGKTVCGATDAEGNQLLLAGYAGRPNGDGGAAAVVVVAQREMDGAKTNYTTNAIESLTAQLRKVIENWSHSRPTRRQQAALAGHPHVETSTPPPGANEHGLPVNAPGPPDLLASSAEHGSPVSLCGVHRDRRLGSLVR
jgi:hypothetical protein